MTKKLGECMLKTTTSYVDGIEKPPSWISHVGVFYFPRTSKVNLLTRPIETNAFSYEIQSNTYLPCLSPGFFPPMLCTSNHPVPSQRIACKGGFQWDPRVDFSPQCEP